MTKKDVLLVTGAVFCVAIILIYYAYFYKPDVYKIVELNNTPAEFLKNDPNLKILPNYKSDRVYQLVYFSDPVNEKKYWEKYGEEDAIITYQSGASKEERTSMIFSDHEPDEAFFKIKNAKRKKWEK